MAERKTTNFIVVHCSATPPDADIAAQTIRKWHTEPPPSGRGWVDIGYHYVVRRSGILEAGRHIEEVGAHVSGHNHDSIGICLVGGVSKTGKIENNFTEQQFMVLRALINELLIKFPNAQVLGHRDFSPDLDGNGVVEPDEWIKGCPSFDVKEWWIKSQGDDNEKSENNNI